MKNDVMNDEIKKETKRFKGHPIKAVLYQMFGPFNRTVQKDGIRLMKVVLAALIVAVGLVTFVRPSGMLTPGFGGVSLLIQKVMSNFFGIEVPFAPINLVLNLLPAFASFFIVGRKFLLFSIFNIFCFSIFVDILPPHPITHDPVLNAVLAAVFNGVGSAIALNSNASGGGTDFVAMIFSTKFNIAVWNYVFIFNVGVLTISAFLFGAEPAIYSMLFQLASTMIVNRLHTRYQRKTVFLIANEMEPLSTDLRRLTKHGVTVFEGIGHYSKQKRYLNYMVVSKNDIHAIKHYLKETNQADKVFMNIFESEKLEGRFHIDPLE